MCKNLILTIVVIAIIIAVLIAVAIIVNIIVLWIMKKAEIHRKAKAIKILYKKMDTLMRINWEGIHPNQTIIIIRELENGKIKRQPYFITEVEKEKRIVRKKTNVDYSFIFPFSGIELIYLERFGSKYSRINDEYMELIGPYLGGKQWSSHNSLSLYISPKPLEIIGWELPTEDERKKLLEQTQHLFTYEKHFEEGHLQESTREFLQQIEKSLTKEEV